MEKREVQERMLAIAAGSDMTALITGPTGTGKTTLARQIHERSRRRGRPFVTVNLATVHEGTIESELFGHERGAFTGAEQRRVGRLELANGGTVFLDEIGELPPRLQARLLEFLQSRVIQPVGGNRSVKLDVRVIAATHRDLEKDVRSGRFREDLFHRLRVLAIRTSPIVERLEEIDAIVHECLARACATHSKPILRISEEVARLLESYDWPGNFRELSNVLEYAVAAAEGDAITARDLPQWFFDNIRGKNLGLGENAARLLAIAEVPLTLDYNETLARFEQQYLSLALGRFRGRINLTARQLGINKTTLIRRIRVYGLEKAFAFQGDTEVERRSFQ